MHYFFALSWRVFDRKSWWKSWSFHDENCSIKLFTSIEYLVESSRVVELSCQVKFFNSTQVLEFNFSIWLDTFSKKFQLDLILFELNTWLELKYSTWRDQFISKFFTIKAFQANLFLNKDFQHKHIYFCHKQYHAVFHIIAKYSSYSLVSINKMKTLKFSTFNR